MSDTTNTSIDELDSHMKDLKVLAIILALMFFITLGYLYLMTISDNGSEGHPAAVHDEAESENEDAMSEEADTTTEEGDEADANADTETDATTEEDDTPAEGDTTETEADTEGDTSEGEAGAEEGATEGDTSFVIDGQIYQIVF